LFCDKITGEKITEDNSILREAITRRFQVIEMTQRDPNILKNIKIPHRSNDLSKETLDIIMNDEEEE
jgi:hypothetical protein